MKAWPLLALLIALPTWVPLTAAIASFGRLDAELWSHLTDYVLPHVLPTTLILLLTVSIGVSILGTLLAALISLFEFPGRKFFAWALLLPLAVPAYVLATVFVGSLDYASPLATWFRSFDISIPEIRNRAGASAVLILSLYPYVYLVVRSSLSSQGARVIEAARSLGLSPVQATFRVAIPLSAPAILGGTLLAAMETLAEFGAVAAFNVDTLTTAIYKSWFSLFSVDAALQLAGVLLLVVVALLIAQYLIQKSQRLGTTGPRSRRIRLEGISAFFATLTCGAVLSIAFAAPAAQLLVWAWTHLADLDSRLLVSAGNSVMLGVLAAGLIAMTAVLLGYCGRQAPGLVTQIATRSATMGYALPGALLAVGLFVPLAAAMQQLNVWLDLGLALQGGLVLMLMAYGVRFTAVAHAPVSAGFARIRPSIDEAARLAGCTGLSQLREVHLPLLKPGLAAALALVFVDVMKEMPITLMTRPFGWDTLAVRIFEMTSEGQWERAALPSVAIVLVGLLPVWWLVRNLDSDQETFTPRGPAT